MIIVVSVCQLKIYINVFFPRCIYNIWVECQYNSDRLAPKPQKVQVLVPGPPKAPQIWTRAVERDEFVIEWGEPRLWGTKLDGYQVMQRLHIDALNAQDNHKISRKISSSAACGPI